MFSTDSAVNIIKRLALGFLLILLLIGFAGHLLAPANDTQHVQSEAACVLHQGITLSVLQAVWNFVGISPEAIHDNACALDLVLKISHPPSL